LVVGRQAELSRAVIPQAESGSSQTVNLARLGKPRTHQRDTQAGAGISRLVPVVFLILPVVVLFALYPGLFTLSRLAR
jgi:hypothetical protein